MKKSPTTQADDVPQEILTKLQDLKTKKSRVVPSWLLYLCYLPHVVTQWWEMQIFPVHPDPNSVLLRMTKKKKKKKSTNIYITCLHERMPFMGLFHKNICYHIRNLLCTNFLKVLWCLQIILSKKKKKYCPLSSPLASSSFLPTVL